ncbi:MAG: hypothetical protein NC388_07910 [Clostridium sp.]|nr:hypothetical protein [Clostridium sp.]
MNTPHFWIWLKRFRHRKGYGVHSPFAFGFITDVIYESGEYYAYQSLEKHYGQRSFFRHRNKDGRLLFRLANYAMPELILTSGASEEEIAWLWAGRRTADCREADKYVGIPDKRVTLFYVNLDGKNGGEQMFEEWSMQTGSQSVAVVRGIYGTTQRRRWWENMKVRPVVGITFDLYDFGIVFFNHKLFKQHYIINY